MSQRARWTIVLVLLVPAVVLPLLVGIYARVDPRLFGFPFFFWFQFLLIPIAAILTTTAYRLTAGEQPPARPEDDGSSAIR